MAAGRPSFLSKRSPCPEFYEAVLRVLKAPRYYQELLLILEFGLGKHNAMWPPANLKTEDFYLRKAAGHARKALTGVEDDDKLDHLSCIAANALLAWHARNLAEAAKKEKGGDGN